MLDMVNSGERQMAVRYLRHAAKVRLLGKGLGKKCLYNQTVKIYMIYSRSFWKKKHETKNIFKIDTAYLLPLFTKIEPNLVIL